MKRAFKYIIPLLAIFLLVIVGFSTGIVDIRRFPEPKGVKHIALNCNHKGSKVEISEDLYQSIDNYYASDPKKRFKSYESYVEPAKEDGTIKELTGKIEAKGKELNLSADETMDLATCFVQSIPYDTEKAKIVLSEKPEERVSKAVDSRFADRYPYETLYEGKGICTDKSYLESAILKEMGYGTALLTFETEKHMAVGVSSPKGYQSFDSGYSYIETTNTSYKVGQLPSIDKGQGGAKNATINKDPADLISDIPVSDFSAPSRVIRIADGREYQRIIEITQEIKKMNDLRVLINSKNRELISLKDELKQDERAVGDEKAQLNSIESKLNQTKAQYKADHTEANYQLYESVYQEYEKVYNESRLVVENFNNKVSIYNSKVSELKQLIGEYNNLVKSD